MAEVLMLNPKRRRRRATSKKRRTTSKRRRSVARRRRNPVSRIGVSSNPRRRYRRRRRNPLKLGGIGNIVSGTIVPAATAAGGALALDVLMGFAPIPENLKSGPVSHVVKGAAAIGMGYIAGMVVKPATAKMFTTGALTVIMHNIGRDALGRFMPNLNLGAYVGDDDDLSAYVSNDIDELSAYGDYDDDDDDELDALEIDSDDDLDL